ncbi:SCO2400 family protein [Streptomyces sp. NBC_00316]|uniref:SCO2400 family protein n=1 Tax=Streptomyces sp. NBC_00316 TaxID=2975710 RepID=UPI003FA7B533
MDYCSSCRRVLNGALVCPGCGDYAPDIAPPARYSAVPTTAPARGERHAAQAPAFRPPHRGAAPFGGSGVSEDVTAQRSDSGSSGGSAVAASTGQGRAARRRQRERWKKNRRRAAAATAFALVSGGLTATLLQSRASTGHTHAAAAPELEGVATPRTLISAASSEEPDTEASRKPRTHRPVTAGRQQKTSPATPPAATTIRQPKTAAAAHPLATSSATPDTAPTQANQAPVEHADVAAPVATAPASTAGSDASTTPVPAAPATPTAEPTSPAHLCLLGIVCVG